MEGSGGCADGSGSSGFTRSEWGSCSLGVHTRVCLIRAESRRGMGSAVRWRKIGPCAPPPARIATRPLRGGEAASPPT